MIKQPYLPVGRQIAYVSIDDPYMSLVREYTREHSLDTAMPTGSVVVREGRVIGKGANGSDYHANNVCERVKRNVATGTGYDLCEGCHPNNHSEVRAIADAKKAGEETEGASLYLWGHWWCCEDCWRAMIEAGIAHVYLLEGSEVLFNKEQSGNIVGHQLEY